jgi:hypothetical protein
MLEFGSQTKLITTKLGSLPSSLKDAIAQTIKGARTMAYQAELLGTRILRLEKALEDATKRKSRKRKRLQDGGALEYEAGTQLVLKKERTVMHSEKRSRGKAKAEGAQPT